MVSDYEPEIQNNQLLEGTNYIVNINVVLKPPDINSSIDLTTAKCVSSFGLRGRIKELRGGGGGGRKH
jgi:hypothetical protein